MIKSLEKAIDALSGMYKGFSEKDNDYGRRGFLKASAAIGTGVLAACCDSGGGSGGSGGGGDDPAPNPGDTVPPGRMDLEAYVSVNNGEEIRLRWVSSGDDDWIGSPDYFIIRYSDQPIVTDDLWEAATDLASVTANGPAGTQYDMHFDIPAGTWYTAIKAVDEAGNESIISNYLPADPVDVKTKAEFYVDKWLPPGKIDLNYAEGVDAYQGDVANGIDSIVDSLSQILINTTDGNGIPFANYATWQDIRDALLTYSDGQPVVVGNQELIDDTRSSQLTTSMNYVCNIWVWDNTTSQEEMREQSFNGLTQGEWDTIHDIIRGYLIQRVEVKSGEYGGVPGGTPDINHSPDW